MKHSILFIFLILIYCSQEGNMPSTISGPDSTINDPDTSIYEDDTTSLSTDFSSIYYLNNSFKIKWHSIRNENFKSFQLFNAPENDTSSWSMVFENNNSQDTLYILNNVPKDIYKYFKIVVLDKDSTISSKQIKLASSYRQIAFSTKIENNHYVCTVDINGNCKQDYPVHPMLPTQNEFDDIRLDPAVFINDEIVCLSYDTWSEDSDNGYLYLFDINEKLITELSDGIYGVCDHPVLDHSKSYLYFTLKSPLTFSYGDLISYNFNTSEIRNLTEDDSFLVRRFPPTFLNAEIILVSTQSEVIKSNNADNIEMNIMAFNINTMLISKYIENAFSQIVTPNQNFIVY